MLSLVDLHKRYGDVVALDGAGFDVPQGRIVGFLGPNGAGKTTAMRCVFGLVRPDSGEVRWNGHVVLARDRLRFGYMPEERGLYPKMRVHEQIAYFGRLSGLSKGDAARNATAWIQRLGLDAYATSDLNHLSHGNQQRAQLAAALVHRPEVLVLDEPFAGLDPIGIESLSALMFELAAAGVAIVFSSHQLDLVEDVCEDVVIIDRGQVVLTGTVEGLRGQSGRRILEVAVDGKAWQPMMAGLVPLDGNDATSRFVVERNVDLESLLALARQSGEVTRFSFEPPSLSELFREAVGR